jgi:hypothetical protein
MVRWLLAPVLIIAFAAVLACGAPSAAGNFEENPNVSVVHMLGDGGGDHSHPFECRDRCAVYATGDWLITTATGVIIVHGGFDAERLHPTDSWSASR